MKLKEMKKTLLLLLIIIGMIIDTKFELIQQTGISENIQAVIKLFGAIITSFIALTTKNPFNKESGLGGSNIPPIKDEK